MENIWVDFIYGVKYSQDRKQLLECSDKEIEEYTVLKGTETICDFAFDGCSALKEITIPASVTSIGEIVFSDCDALESIFIPRNAREKLEIMLLDYKQKLVEINLSTKVEDEDLANAWEDEYGAKYSPDRKRLLKFSSDRELTNYAILEGTEIICDCAFEECSALKEITIPNSVTSIGDNAFDSCSALKEITIPNSVTSIGNCAFYGCI